ncbi:MAG: 1-(5-phosphoribosyl)-5-[(5-phosphoribosylamino)methylideneamino] imidazole-4-carboxamide isomerase [Acidobacteriaceae bacterium]|nr:1-(5-phosphoribosyl)-5-[(5-phosphoribosylamino)methylideneamino] imidazole-4-carboxamide isomerase [Acidobacteriaceae bacterium]
MIIPCIDLMDGKVVQLVQGREKALEGKSPDEMLELFARFPQIQVIDLDAAMGKGSNSRILEHLARRATIRVGGGVRTVGRARELVEQGAHCVIIGTAAFTSAGPNFQFLSDLRTAVGASQLTIALDSKNGHIVVKGWQEATQWTAVDLISQLEPYCSSFLCTYVDKEGMMQGTDLHWFETLRQRTQHELVAAGGITTLNDVQALSSLNIHCAIGMSIYTGRLCLEELADLNEQLMTARNCY